MKISEIPKFYKRYWKFFAVVGVLVFGLVSWIRLTDPHIDEVKEFLISKKETCENLGEIKELSLIKTTILLRPGDYGRAQEPDRKIYTFVATGTKGKEKVVANVLISESDQVGKITVKCEK